MTQNNIQCPECGHPIPVVIADPVVFRCDQCNNIIRITDKGLFEKEAKLSKTSLVSSPAWLKPGARIKHKGKEYTLFSVYCHGVHWNEYDPEDNKYEQGYSEYLEWYFVAKDGAELCLEQTDNDNKFQIRNSIPITDKLINGVKGLKIGDKIPEYGTYQLVGFEGQDDEPLDRDTWKYQVIKEHAAATSVEWKNNMPTNEWQAHKVQQIGILELERWKVRTAEEVAEARENTKKLGFFRDVFGYATLALLALMVYSGIKGSSNELCFISWNFAAPRTVDSTSNRTALYQRALCTVTLEKNQPYRFKTKCSFQGSNNASANFSISILKLPEGTPVNNISASFYTESGRDSEGAWTESTLSDYFNFVADESGEYEIYARVNPESPTDNETHAGTLQTEIKPILMTRYFVFAMLVCALIWLIYQWRWEYQALKAEVPVSTWLQGMFK
jgi:hypothetical protein